LSERRSNEGPKGTVGAGPDVAELRADVTLYEVDGGVAWLTMNRPQAHNALSKDLRDGLRQGFGRFRDDPDARVLVLTGAGDKAFSAGGDLKEMAETELKVPPPDSCPT
jgi:enoyl-CoA hydratase/carnithine racemase